MRKMISFILVFAMLITVMPISAFADVTDGVEIEEIAEQFDGSEDFIADDGEELIADGGEPAAAEEVIEDELETADEEDADIIESVVPAAGFTAADIGIAAAAAAISDFWGEPIPEAFPRNKTTGPTAGGFPQAGLVLTSTLTINSAATAISAGGVLVDGYYVIENREFTGAVTISLGGATLRGCYIPGRVTVGAAGVTVDYCEMYGATLNSSEFILTNCDISNGTNIINVGGGVTSGLIEGNYVHDLIDDWRGILINDGARGVTVKGNSVLIGPSGYRSYITGSNVSDLTFEENYLSGGNLILHFYSTPPVGANCKVINNTYSTFHDNAGVWGFLQCDNPTSYMMQRGHLANGISGNLPNGQWQGVQYNGNVAVYPEPWEDDGETGDPGTLYQIRFNRNDGMLYAYNMPENVRVYGLEIIEEPISPKRTGYDFGGWYKEGACLNRWDFDNDVVVSDVTLYAKWVSVGFRPPVAPSWYTPLPLPDVSVPNWQIAHEFPNANNTGTLPGWGIPGSGAANELIPLYGVIRPAGSGTPDLQWLSGGVEQNPDNINPHDDGTHEWVRRTLGTKPDWTHNDNAALPGITSWTTWALRYGFTTVTDAYIAANGGRVSDPESPDYGCFVIENRYILGGLRINARDIIVRNCYIEACSAMWGGGHVDSGVGDLTWGGQGAVYIVQGASLTIANCEINGLEGVHAAIWHDGEYLVAVGNNIHDSNDGVYHWGSVDCGNNYLFQDNWVHNLSNKTSNGHVDGWQAGGGNGAVSNGHVIHNFFQTGYYDSGAYAHYGPGKYVLVENNLFEGSGYTIYSYSQSAAAQTNQWFRDNAFEDLNGARPRVGFYGVWYGSQPQDGWHMVRAATHPFYATVNVDPYNFDPYTTPSIRYGNVVRSTGENIDHGNPGEPFLDPGILPDGWWANSGSGTLLPTGRHELGSWTGEFTIEFKLRPLAYPTDSAVGYTRTGISISDLANPWSSFNILGGARPNGIIGFHDGVAWTTQNALNSAFPALTTDEARAAQVASMTNEQLAAINPYLKKYEKDVTYEMRIHVINGRYTVWARELDAGENPIEEWFCLGENYGFRNTTTGPNGNDVAAVWVGPGGALTYAVGDHEVYEGEPFDKGDKYELTVLAGDNGRVSFASGEFVAGRNVAILAIPDAGYKFAYWSSEEGGGEFANEFGASTVFTMPDNPATIMAHFVELDYFDVTVTAGEGGSVNDASGVYSETAAVSIVATALPAYRFVNWTIVSGSGVFANANSASTTFTASSDAVIIANFEARVYYALTVAAGDGGSVNTSGGMYEAGQSVSIAATPGEDYRFRNWTATAGTFANANSASTSFVMPASDAAVTANFDAREYHSVTVSATEGGSVNDVGGDKYESGDRISIIATALPDYKFTGWTFTGSGAITNAGLLSTTFTVGDGDAAITANFEARVYYSLDITSDEGGTLNTTGGRFEEGDKVSIAVTAGRGYRFASWDISPEDYIGAAADYLSAATVLTMPAADLAVHAVLLSFDPPPEFAKVQFASAPMRAGMPAASLWYDHFDNTFSFSPSTGHGAYNRWTRNWATGTVDTSGIGIYKQGVDGPSNYELEKHYFNFVMPFIVETRLMFPSGASAGFYFNLTVANATIATVRFDGEFFNIFMFNGTTDPVASVDPDEWFLLQAAIVPDMSEEDLYDRWANSVLTLIVDRDVPVFRQGALNIAYNPVWAIPPLDRSTEVGDPTNQSVAGIRWGTYVPAGQTGQTWIDMLDVYEVSVVEIVEPVYYTLTVVAGDGGSVFDSGGEYLAGSVIELSATADEGYYFVNWTATGGYFADETSASTTFTMPENDAVVMANFSDEEIIPDPNPDKLAVVEVILDPAVPKAGSPVSVTAVLINNGAAVINGYEYNNFYFATNTASWGGTAIGWHSGPDWSIEPGGTYSLACNAGGPNGDGLWTPADEGTYWVQVVCNYGTGNVYLYNQPVVVEPGDEEPPPLPDQDKLEVDVRLEIIGGEGRTQIETGDEVRIVALLTNGSDQDLSLSDFTVFNFAINWGSDLTGWNRGDDWTLKPGESCEFVCNAGGPTDDGIWRPLIAMSYNVQVVLNWAGSGITTWGKYAYSRAVTVTGFKPEKPPIVWNPPTLPDWYAPLPDNVWPDETNTGLLPGWSIPALIIEGGETMAAETGANILAFLTGPKRAGVPVQPFIGGDDDWAVSVGIQDSVSGPLYADPYYSEHYYVPVTFATNGRDGTTNTPVSNAQFNSYQLLYAQLVIDEAYIAANGGRAADGQFYIENAYVLGGLMISAKDVTVRNCYIEASYGHKAGMNDNGQGLINIGAEASATIINCELNGLKGVQAGLFSAGERTVFARSNVYNVCDGVYQWHTSGALSDQQQQGDNFTIQDNYFHGFTHNVSNGHKDGLHNHGCSNGLIKHNAFLNPEPCATSAIIMSDGYSDIRGIMVENNLMGGGGFTFYAFHPLENNDTVTDHIWVLNNVFTNRYNRTSVGVFGIWYNMDPSDGWFRPDSFDYATFDPPNTPSFHYGNTLLDDHADSDGSRTGELLDLRQPSDPMMPDPSLLQPGDWLATGENTSMSSTGRHDLGSYTGIVTMQFLFMPTGDFVDTGVAYTRTGQVVTGAPPTGSLYNIIFGARSNGFFDMYQGNGTGAGAWPLSGFDAGTPADDLPANAKRYKGNTWYEVRIVADTDAMTYSAWVREIDEDGKPIEKWFVIGEDYGFRNVTTNPEGENDIATVYVGPWAKFGYVLRGHSVIEGYPADPEPIPDEVLEEYDAAVAAAMNFLERDFKDYTAESAAAARALVEEVLEAYGGLDPDVDELEDYEDAIAMLVAAVISAEAMLVLKPPVVVKTLVSAVPDIKSIKIVEDPKHIWTVTFKVTETYSDKSVVVKEHSITAGKNSDGTVNLGLYTLRYDIKGNGSNIKMFVITINK